MNLGELWAVLGIDSTQLEHSVVAMRTWEGKMNASLLRVQRQLDATSARFATMQRGMFRYMILPMAAVGVASFKMYKDFEFNMNKVVSLVGVARKQVDAWSKEILAMAPKVGKGPVELAKAMYFITSAGIRGAEAMEILSESARSSVSGLGEVKVVADLLTSAMNAYGKENLSAARANDILTATVREGKAEADLLAQSLGLVLPIASAMGSTFDQVGAATAAMTRTGTKAATAAIQLRQIFNSLLKPAKEAEAALGHMKTSSAALRRVIKEEGLLAALVELDRITKEYGINAMGKVIPNIRSLTGVLDIMGKNFESNVKLTKAIRDSFGDANKMFAETAHTVEFRLNASIARVQSSMVKFGEAVTAGVMPIMERLSIRIERIVENFDALSNSEKTAKIQTGLWAGKLFLLVAAFSMLTKLASNLIFIFRGLMKWVSHKAWPTLAKQLGRIGLATKGISLAVVGIAAAFAAMLAAGTMYGRKIEKDLKKEYELRKAGIKLKGVELEAYKKLNKIQRELEVRRLTEIEHQKQLNEQYGEYIKLIERVEGLTMETLGLPGMNITQLEDLRDKAEGTIGDIQHYVEELSKTAEIEIPVGLGTMDPSAIVSYLTTQARMIEQSLIEGVSGQEMYNAYQGTFKDIGRSFEEEMEKSSTNMHDAFSTNAMAMGATMAVVSDSMINSLNTGAWLDDPGEAFFGRMVEGAEGNSEMMNAIARKQKDDETAILEKKSADILTIISVVNAEIQRQAEESRKKLKSIAEAEVGVELGRQMKTIATMGQLIWTELEVAEAKVGAFETALTSLADLGVGPTDERMQRWLKSLIAAQKEVTRLDVGVTDLTEAMKDLQTQLAIAAYKSAAFFDFDAEQAELKAYETYLSKLIERRQELLSVAGPTETTTPDISHLVWDTSAPTTYKTEIMKVEEQIQSVIRAMELLKMTAGKPTGMQLFGEIGKEILAIDALVKKGFITPLDAAQEKFKLFEKNFALAVSGGTRMAGLDLTNFLNWTKEEMEKFGAEISKAEFWEDFTKAAQVALQTVGQLFGALGQLYQTQMQNEISAMENSVKNRNKSEKWLAAQRERIQNQWGKKIKQAAIAEALVNGALAMIRVFKDVPFPWSIPVAALVATMVGIQIANIRAQKMAEGGIVPPGYPRDSYPALLTSGEEVIPARQRRSETAMGGKVVFEIEGDKLVGILEKRKSVAANF